MAYADLPLLVADDPAVVGDWNQARSNFLFFRDVPKCSLFHSVDRAISNNTAEAVAFDSEHYDNDGMHSNVTNNSRATVQTAGKYDVTGGLEWASNVTGIRELRIVVNNTTVIRAVRIDAVSSGVTQQSVSRLAYPMAVGDYFQLQVIQTSGGNLNVLAKTAYSPEMEVVWRSA